MGDNSVNYTGHSVTQSGTDDDDAMVSSRGADVRDELSREWLDNFGTPPTPALASELTIMAARQEALGLDGLNRLRLAIRMAALRMPSSPYDYIRQMLDGGGGD